MDIAELILTQPVSPPAPLRNSSELDGTSEEEKKQIAKDFESVLVNKLLDEMKNTIGDWGFEKDGASKQVQGIFWLYLARDIANNGGFGLWKDIYQFLTNSDQASATTELPGKSV
jgi:Rod binding domain-containing protein